MSAAPPVPHSDANEPPTGGRTPAIQLDPRTYGRALGCVHCGLCLPACPTYTETGHEADSPRGRIQLIRALADAEIDLTDSVKHHLDLCLDCRACETACPSGVVYHELIEETRARMASSQSLSAQSRFMRWTFFNIFTHPTRLKLALLPARLLQKIRLYPLLRRSGVFRLLPAQLRKMEQMLPSRGPLWPAAQPEKVSRPPCESRGPASTSISNGPTIGLLTGCIGGVMFADVNRKAAELLAACGATVLSPRSQGCCGAIHHHNGAHAPAEAMARHNIDTFIPRDGPAVDFIVTNIAGCGAMLREYDLLLRDDPQYAPRAQLFVSKVRDITEVLLAIGLPEMKHAVNETITYHDACHLAHAQRVSLPPRQLLAKVPGLKMTPLPESDMCCGAAGTYNLTQPGMATQLAARKLRHIASTGAEICVTGNVGCAMQIQSEAAARAQTLTVRHPVEILHRAVFGDQPA